MDVLIHNVETGEIVERKMTKAEADQLALDNAAAISKQADEAAKAAAKEAAQAKLAALGLTRDDLKVLGL